MRVLFKSLFMTLILLSAPLAAPAGAQSMPMENRPASFADMVERLLPSVVNISSTQKPVTAQDFPDMPQFPPGSPFEDFFDEFMDRRGLGMPSIPPTSLGSGFIVDAEKGYIVTNSHVVKGADDVHITFHDDSTLDAEVIARDEKTDIAILKVDTDKALNAVSFGDSSHLRVGDWVLAIGNPFGLGGTVTAGIVSAQKRNINAGPYDDFIQTDASINRGNSGGPMFNLDGEVIGINTAIYSPSGGSVGIGFAIPSDLAKPVIDQLIEYGRTRRGWLGVRIQTVTDESAESLGLESARGALIASVTPTGPAEMAGLKAGDIITEFNGTPIEEMRALPRVVAETKIGSEAELKFWRDNKEQQTTVKVGELEKAEENGLIASTPYEEQLHSADEGVPLEAIGLHVRSITPQDRLEYELGETVEGLFISNVKDMSDAAIKEIMPGDVILEINQQKVTDPQTAKDIVEKAQKAGRKSVLLLIEQAGEVRFVPVTLTQPD